MNKREEEKKIKNGDIIAVIFSMFVFVRFSWISLFVVVIFVIQYCAHF